MTPASWTLLAFVEALEEWIDREDPPDGLRFHVTGWIFSRMDDPYDGVRRQEGFPNLWYGLVPGTAHGAGQVVVCAYWIEDATRVIRCDSFATLSAPA